MKKILLISFVLIGLLIETSYSQSYTPMTAYGYQYKRIKVDSVMLLPQDTLFSKTGLAMKAGTLYVGNGAYWAAAGTGGGGTTDTVATKWPLYVITGGTYDSLAIRQSWIDSALNNGSSVVDTTLTWSVLDSLNTPPALTFAGNIYLVGTAASGAFSGHANQIATLDTLLAYSFSTPTTGDLLYNATTNIVSQWTGTAWVRVSTPIPTGAGLTDYLTIWTTNSTLGISPIHKDALNNIIIPKNIILDTTTTLANGIIYKGDRTFLHNFSPSGEAGNTFLGINTGNFTMGGGTFVEAARNTIIGAESFKLNTLGYRNAGIGTMILAKNTTGHYNMAVGDGVLQENTTGAYNIAIGGDAMGGNKTGDGNVAIGTDALRGIDSLFDFTAIGHNALTFATMGGASVAIGAHGLWVDRHSYGDVAIGTSAGESLDSSSYSTYIGFHAGFDASQKISPSNAMALGAFSYNNRDHQITFGSTNVYENVMFGQLKLGEDMTAPNSSAQLHMQDTDKGLLMNKVTTTQMNAIVSPATGLEVFNTTLGVFMYYNGASWVAVGSGSISGTTNYLAKFNSSTTVGNSVAYDDGTNIGIGTTSPASKFSVTGISTFSNASYDGAFSPTLYLTDAAYTTSYRNKISTSVSASPENQKMLFSIGSGASTFKDVLTLTGIGTVGVNTTTPSEFSVLDVVSTTKGSHAAPSMTNTQMLAATAQTGDMVFNITLNSFMWYNGAAWVMLGSSSLGIDDVLAVQQRLSTDRHIEVSGHEFRIEDSLVGSGISTYPIVGTAIYGGTNFILSSIDTTNIYYAKKHIYPNLDSLTSTPFNVVVMDGDTLKKSIVPNIYSVSGASTGNRTFDQNGHDLHFTDPSGSGGFMEFNLYSGTGFEFVSPNALSTFQLNDNTISLFTNGAAVTLTPATSNTKLDGKVSLGYVGTPIASASTLTLASGNVFHVSGTTNITSISGTNINPGTIITIIFDGILTFTDGSNLKLAGSFVTTADATITLVYDGSNWYETSRSTNNLWLLVVLILIPTLFKKRKQLYHKYKNAA